MLASSNNLSSKNLSRTTPASDQPSGSSGSDLDGLSYLSNFLPPLVRRF